MKIQNSLRGDKKMSETAVAKQKQSINKLQNNKWLIFAVTGVACFIVTYSVNSVSLALPYLAKEFGVAQSSVSWLTMVYSLIPCCCLLVFGSLGDIWGYKKQFAWGFAFFGIVSLLMPILSVSLPVLIFFRCLQGVGYSMLISITQAIIARVFPLAERGKALGCNTIFVSIGLASGPTIGGILLSAFGWHSIFWFCVPFCLLGFITTLVIMPTDEKRDRNKSLDWQGGVLFALGIGFLSVGVNFINSRGLNSFMFWGCLAVSICGFLLFVFRENRATNPLMALGLFKNRGFTFANAAICLNFIMQQMVIYLVPFYLADVLLLKSHVSGIVMMATPLMMLIFSPVGGSLADRKGTRLPALTGLILIFAGSLIISLLAVDSPLWVIIIALLITGMGNAFFSAPVNSSVMSSVPLQISGMASGMVATMRNIGQTFGVAIGTLFITLGSNYYAARGVEDGAELYLLAESRAFIFCMVLVVAAWILVMLLPKTPPRRQSK